MGSKFGRNAGSGGTSAPVPWVTTAELPAPSAGNIGQEWNVTDMNGTTRVQSDGASILPVGAGSAADGTGSVIVTGSRNLARTDAGKTLKVQGASAVTLTLVTGLGPEFKCWVQQCGTGKATIAATGAVVHAQGAKFSCAAQWAEIKVCATDTTDDYLVTGQSGT